ncbi:MAG: DoxX family protein [Aeromicrobium sp.]|uniref:DoxX family protein n=1 Tax=Aeromicrobium sp. TaxID=1871063 RepID=UPI003C664436
MTLLRVVARPMIASMFVVGGASAIKNPGLRAKKAQPVADLVKKMVPETPLDAVMLVRLNGAVHVGAGLALATGRMPRLSAAVLAATMPATTMTGHRFWEETDPAARTNQTVHFLKNVTITGGLLMSTLDPDPHKKFIGRRAKDKVVQASDTVQSALQR